MLECVIIGGGLIGLACAHYVLRSGRGVTVVDAGAIGQGSSWANCGLVTPSHAPPLAVPGAIRKTLKWMLDRRSPFYVRPTLDLATLAWFACMVPRKLSQSALIAHRAMSMPTPMKAESKRLQRPIAIFARWVHAHWQ